MDSAHRPALQDTVSQQRVRELLREVQGRIGQIVEGRDRDGRIPEFVDQGSDEEVAARDDDEMLVQALGAAAAIAIANARLYRQAQVRQSWIEATRDITTELLRGTEPAAVFRLVAEQARTLTGADAAAVAVPADESASGGLAAELVIVETVGNLALSWRGRMISVAGGPIGQVLGAGVPQRIEWLEGAGLDGLAGLDEMDQTGAALLLPLRAADAVAGVVILLRDRMSPPFNDEELDMMAAFTDQASLAWQLATSRHRMRRLDVLAERDRIARDLHDHVIQRIFGAGLALQGAVSQTDDQQLRQRLSGAVDDLQAVIGEIRAAVFDLRGAAGGIARLRGRISGVINQFAGGGLRTSVHFVGPLAVVDSALAEHAEAVVTEAVSNAVRHSHATTLTVRVQVDDELRIDVVDDGCGIPDQVAESGLANLRRRAEQVGGEFTFECPAAGGTVLHWSAPLYSD